MKIKIGDKIFYKSTDWLGALVEKHGIVEKIKGDKVYLGQRKWVQIKNIVNHGRKTMKATTTTQDTLDTIHNYLKSAGPQPQPQPKEKRK